MKVDKIGMYVHQCAVLKNGVSEFIRSSSDLLFSLFLVVLCWKRDEWWSIFLSSNEIWECLVTSVKKKPYCKCFTKAGASLVHHFDVCWHFFECISRSKKKKICSSLRTFWGLCCKNPLRNLYTLGLYNLFCSIYESKNQQIRGQNSISDLLFPHYLASKWGLPTFLWCVCMREPFHLLWN